MTASIAIRTRSSRSWFKLAALAGALAFAGAAGQASAQPYNGDGPSSSDLGQICQSVVGASPGEAHYVGCVENLSESRSAFDHDRAVGQARASCLEEGLRPDTAELAQCALSRSRTVRASDVRPVVSSGRPGATKSYFYASPNEAHRREETSCAGLGLAPGSSGFTSCVAGMQSAMFAADNPLN
jgi:hypothetical protein